MIRKIIIYMFFLFLSLVESYPSGAPTVACDTMTPRHSSFTPQNASSSPYNITATYNQEEATVTISGSDTFRGILLTARTTQGDEIVGRWTTSNSNFKNLNCGSETNNAITHTERSDKNLPISFKWTSTGFEDDTNVTFFVTVVKVLSTFYVKLPSQAFIIKKGEGKKDSGSGSGSGNHVGSVTLLIVMLVAYSLLQQ